MPEAMSPVGIVLGTERKRGKKEECSVYIPA